MERSKSHVEFDARLDALESVPKVGGIAALEQSSPIYLAHRGLPLVYPEHTMEAYRGSIAAGANTLECDCYLLADGAVGVMHDTTLDRTTTTSGNTSAQTSITWQSLVIDAGAQLGAPWGNLKAPLFDEVLREFGNKVVLTPEAKNTGSGAAIVKLLQRHGIRKDMVIVSSFVPAELVAAINAGYRTMIAYGTYAGSPTPEALKATGYYGVVSGPGVADAQLKALRAAGLKTAVYTINQRYLAAQYPSADMIYTDDEIYMRGLARRGTDTFDLQTWYHGMQAVNGNGANSGRGAFVAPDMWGYDLATGNIWAGALQGWASPIGGNDRCESLTVTGSFRFDAAFDATRFLWIGVFTEDRLIADDATTQLDGYNFALRKNGQLAMFRYSKGVAGGQDMGSFQTAAIADGAVVSFKLTITPTSVKWERTDVAGSVTVNDTAIRPANLQAGVKGAKGYFKDITITTP